MPRSQDKPTANGPRSSPDIAFWILILGYVALAAWLLANDDGFLRYQPLADEIFSQSQHDLVKTEQVCRGDSCDEVPSEWRDKTSNIVFSRTQFAEHRRAEAWRIATNWFIFAFAACLMAAWYRSHYAGESFLSLLGLFLAMDAVAAVVIALQIM